MSRATFVTVSLVALLIAGAAAPVFAASTGGGFGVSPVQLDFTDPPLLRGQDASGSLRLQNGYDQPVRVTLQTSGDVAEWVAFPDGDTFEMPAKSSRALEVDLKVPETAPNGDHAGLLRIRATSADAPEGSGASISVEVLPSIQVRVTGEQVLRFTAEKVTVADRPPNSPLLVEADALNVGNVRAQPRFLLVVEDEEGREVLRETITGPGIEPKTSRHVELPTEGTLPLGIYTAHVSLVEAQGGEAFPPLGFEVREKAEAASVTGTPSGAVGALDIEPGARVGALVAVRTRFVNDGTAPVEAAKLTAEVYRDGERVAVVHSDALRVPVSQGLDLEAFYEPEAPGEHVVKGYVTYDGVRTAVQEATFEVAGDDGPGTGAAGKGEPGSEKTPGPGMLLVLGALALAGVAWRRRRGG